MVAQMLTKKAVLKIYWNSQENIFAEVFFFNEVAIFYRVPANGSFRTWPTVFHTNDMDLFKILRKLPYKKVTFHYYLPSVMWWSAQIYFLQSLQTSIQFLQYQDWMHWRMLQALPILKTASCAMSKFYVIFCFKFL